MPEATQIGRVAQIDELEEKLRVNDVLLLMEGRRTGKTSLAAAALDRISASGRVAVATLTRFETQGAAARFVDAQLQARQKKLGFSFARVLESFEGSGAPELIPGQAAELLGIADHLAAAATALRTDLSDVLAAASGSGAVLLDEAHAMLAWTAREKGALNAVLRGRLNIGVVLASSDREALDRLTAKGEPLHLVGSRIRPAPIATNAWFVSLRERFHSLGIEISERVILNLVEETGGQPYLTMRLCREVADRATRPDGSSAVTGAVLEASVYALSHDDPVWKELDGHGR